MQMEGTGHEYQYIHAFDSTTVCLEVLSWDQVHPPLLDGNLDPKPQVSHRLSYDAKARAAARDFIPPR